MPVFFLGTRADELRPALWGFAAGTMGVVSVLGLLKPALDEGSLGQAAAGLALGIGFMLAARSLLNAHEVRIGERDRKGMRSSVLVFVVLFVHSFPEGFAIGTAYASQTVGLGLFVIVAIALQNVPEGTSVAIPMEVAGFGRAQQFWAAVATSAPQPIAALMAYALVEQISALLPLSFSFAAGAMLSLVAVEVLPQALAAPRRAAGIAGTVFGALLMVIFSALLGV